MSIVGIELAASKLKSELLNENGIDTVFGALFENGELDESALQSEEVLTYKALMEEFINMIYDYMSNNLHQFIGENAQDTYRNMAVFAAESFKTFLEELCDISVAANKKDIDDETIFALINEAAYFSLMAGKGALDLLTEANGGKPGKVKRLKEKLGGLKDKASGLKDKVAPNIGLGNLSSKVTSKLSNVKQTAKEKILNVRDVLTANPERIAKASELANLQKPSPEDVVKIKEGFKNQRKNALKKTGITAGILGALGAGALAAKEVMED